MIVCFGVYERLFLFFLTSVVTSALCLLSVGRALPAAPKFVPTSRPYPPPPQCPSFPSNIVVLNIAFA